MYSSSVIVTARLVFFDHVAVVDGFMRAEGCSQPWKGRLDPQVQRKMQSTTIYFVMDDLQVRELYAMSSLNRVRSPSPYKPPHFQSVYILIIIFFFFINSLQTHPNKQTSVSDSDSFIFKMQFFTNTLIVAFIASVSALPTTETSLVARSLIITPSSSEICPQANGLWYVSGKGYMYQIACSVDTTGTTMLFGQDGTSGSQHAENVIQCAE